MNGRYKCSICGHVYKPEEGDPYEKIEPGTQFPGLPDLWRCPVCLAAKDKFSPGE